MALLWRTSSQVWCIKCRRLNLPVPKPVFFFSGVQKEGYRYCLSCKVAFLFVFLGTVPKGLAAFFLPAITTLQVACGTPSTNVAVAASYRLNFCAGVIVLLCRQKNDIKTSCPKSKVEVLLLVRVLSPLYVWVKDMGKHQWTAGQPFMWIGFRLGLSLHFQVSYCHIVLLNNIPKN